MIGTSDQSCWLAEACKILLLLQAFHIKYRTNTMYYIRLDESSFTLETGQA